jgi:hypothetical protein
LASPVSGSTLARRATSAASSARPQGQGDLGAEALQGVTGLVGDQLGVPGQLGRGVQAEQPGGGLGGHPVDGGGIGRGQQGHPGRGQQPERRL